MSLAQRAARHGDRPPTSACRCQPRTSRATGSPPETVSRVLRRLQQSSVIRVERRELEIVDGAELERLAGDVLRG